MPNTLQQHALPRLARLIERCRRDPDTIFPFHQALEETREPMIQMDAPGLSDPGRGANRTGPTEEGQ